MKNSKHIVVITKAMTEFIKRCAAEANETSVEFMMSASRKRKAAISRQLVLWYFRTNCPEFKVGLAEIGALVGKDHATTLHSKRVVDSVTEKSDEQLFKAKSRFIFLTENFNMETLLIECEKRDDEKNSHDKDRIHKLNSLNKYNRAYKKVIVKLIRTEDKLPTKRDFALIEHILNH